MLAGKAKRDTARVVVGDRVRLEPDPDARAPRDRRRRAPHGAPRASRPRRPRHPAGRRQRGSGLRRHGLQSIPPPSPSSSIACSSWPRPTRSPPPSSSTRSISIRARRSSSAHDARATWSTRPARTTGDGMAELAAALAGRISVVTGPSGAGKSSLLNRLQPGLQLRTGEISAKVRRGKHTTVSAVMLPLDAGGYLVDTPGFSEVGLWGIDPGELDTCFPEFRPVPGRLPLRRLPPPDRARAAACARRRRRRDRAGPVGELPGAAGGARGRAGGVGIGQAAIGRSHLERSRASVAHG